MAKRAGRNLVLKKGLDIIGGVRMLSVKFDATPIDVTDSDSNGIIALLSGEAASKQVTIEASGVADTNFLRSLAVAPGTNLLLTDLTFTDPGAPPAGDILSGDFFMTSYAENGSHDGAVEFSASFVSSGAWAVA